MLSDSFQKIIYSKFACLDHQEGNSRSDYDKIETLSCIIVNYLYLQMRKKHQELRYNMVNE